MTRRVGSLFSGVGGLDLAVHEVLGGEPAWFVEQNAYCQQVLRKRWPGTPVYDDVCMVGSHNLSPIDVLCGGFPCQGLSIAGHRLCKDGRKRGLIDDDRSVLFFEFARIAKELRPKHIVIENVPALLSDWRGLVERTLAPEYGLTWVKAAAANVGAPHLRWRVFILGTLGGKHLGVCHADSPAVYSLSTERWATPTASDQKNRGKATDPCQQRRIAIGKQINLSHQAGGRLSPNWVEALMGFPAGWTDVECDVPQPVTWPAPMVRGMWGDSPQHDWEPPRVVAGKTPHRAARLKALGNAVVPAQAALALRMAQDGPKQLSLLEIA